MEFQLSVDITLSKPVSMTLHPSLGEVMRRSGKVSKVVLEKGDSFTFWMSPLEGTQLPKGVAFGDLLLGKVGRSREGFVCLLYFF